MNGFIEQWRSKSTSYIILCIYTVSSARLVDTGSAFPRIRLILFYNICVLLLWQHPKFRHLKCIIWTASLIQTQSPESLIRSCVAILGVTVWSHYLIPLTSRVAEVEVPVLGWWSYVRFHTHFCQSMWILTWIIYFILSPNWQCQSNKSGKVWWMMKWINEQ